MNQTVSRDDQIVAHRFTGKSFATMPTETMMNQNFQRR
jgi:hypothetical protein